jgi:hypothetical protein
VTNASTVTLTLNNCTGPYGLSQATGALILTYSNVTQTSQAASGNIVMRGAHFNDNGGTFNYAMTGGYSATGNVLTLMTASSLNGTTSDGNNFQRTPAQMVLTFNKGSGCFVMNGTETLTVNGNSWTTQATNYTRCAGQCPSSGTFRITAPGGEVVTATFNGTANVQLNDSNGATGTQPISCL